MANAAEVSRRRHKETVVLLMAPERGRNPRVEIVTGKADENIVR